MRYAAQRILLTIHAAVMTASVSVASDCNQPPSTPVINVNVPGHPFSIVSTPDGCWLFVSLTSDDPKSNGIGVLRRMGGTLTVERVYPVEARKGRDSMRPGPSGMVVTHDGELLIAANDY